MNVFERTLDEKIFYDNVASLPHKWDESTLNDWLIRTADVRIGWCTIEPKIEDDITLVRFEERVDYDLFISTFDFQARDNSR